MATENPNNFPMPERYLQMYPLHCHIADEFIKGLWAHPGQAPSSAPTSTIKVWRLPEAASSMAAALPRRRPSVTAALREEPAGLSSARFVTSRKKNHG